MSPLLSDLRLSARSLRRTPGFTLVALMALSLGLGGATAMFTLVHGVLLKPLAYRDSSRLVYVAEVVRELSHLAPALPVNARHFDAWRERCAALQDAALINATALNLTGAGEPERLEGVAATASLFDTLGVAPAYGRGFTADEEQPGKDRVVVLSHGLWQRRFGQDPGIVGRTVTLDGASYQVIGVMPPEFRMPGLAASKLVNLPDLVDFYRPLVINRSKIRMIGEFNYMALGRLRAGASLPRAHELSLDWQVAAAGLLLSLLTALAFGALPALRLAAVDPQDALRAGSHTITDSRSSVRLRGLLVAVQTGLSAALLVFAGLLAASLFRLTTLDKGFRVERVLASDIVLPASSYAGQQPREAFYRRLLESMQQEPGIESAAITSHPILGGASWVNPMWTDGDARRMVERPMANLRFISPSFFATMGMPLAAGRPFAEADRGKNVAVLSLRSAEALWPGLSPIGRKFYTFTSRGETLIEVVGVVRDSRSVSLDGEPPLMAYFPYWQESRGSALLIVRTVRDPLTFAASLRHSIRSVYPSVPVAHIRTMAGVVDEATARQRFQVRLAIGFAAFALLLVSLGVYGVAAFWVARRRPEIGIRLAMGANRGQVARLVAFQGALPAAAGLALGLATAWAGGRLIQSLLFGISAADVRIYAVAALLLGCCVAIALLVPAWSASRTRPSSALRYE